MAVFLVAAMAVPAAAQDVGAQRISGIVVNESTGQPVPGAHVQVVGTQVNTVTDENGRFILTGLSGAEVQVRVVMLGFRSLTQTLQVGTTNVRLPLGTTAIALDALVVTGTANATQARALGNAVGRVNVSEVAEVRATPLVTQLLSGHVPGVRIQNHGGAVGASADIRIRGISSLSLSNEPIIIVDGVRVHYTSAQGGVAFSGLSESGPSRLNDWNPDDIESIEVVKGPAAATLYGTEASNGVIQIITKRGQRGQPRFDLNIRRGANFLTNPIDRWPTLYSLDAETGELIAWNRLQWNRDQGFASPFTTGRPQGYTLSMNGGSDAVRYYASTDYDSDEGILAYNWSKRFTGRSNLTYVRGEDLQVGLSFGMVRSRLRSSSPIQQLSASIGFGRTPYSPQSERFGDDRFRREAFEELDRTTVSLNARQNIRSWLHHRLTIGTDVANGRQSNLNPRDLESTASTAGSKSIGTRRDMNITFDWAGTLDWDLREELKLSSSVGAQYYRRTGATTSVSGSGFPVPGVETVSAAATTTGGEGFTENITVGLFIQEQLAWKNRLFLTGGLRGDDNSAFGKDYEFVLYPKLSASWVVSEEPFWQYDFLNSLRLRAAWGRAGQQPSTFAAARTYIPVVGTGGIPSLSTGATGNPLLEPEVGEELEFGFDVSALEDRVTFELTYYDKLTRGAIISRPALRSMGFSGNQFLNLGGVKNTGFEVGLTTQLVRTQNVGWDVRFAHSTNDNYITSLGGVPPGSGDERNLEGMPVGGIYMKKVVSAEFDENKNVINAMCEGGDPVKGGGPPVPCAEAGTAYWGRTTPSWEGGITTNVNLFGKLRLSAMVDYMGGHTMRVGDLAAAHILFRLSHAVLARTDPVLMAYDLPEVGHTWQSGTMDMGFAKLRNVSATYTLPDRWVAGFGASRASITVSGDNLATLWKAQEGTFGLKNFEIERRRNTGTSGYVQDGYPVFTRVLTSMRVSF